jgi:hypothetical protein
MVDDRRSKKRTGGKRKGLLPPASNVSCAISDMELSRLRNKFFGYDILTVCHAIVNCLTELLDAILIN